MEKKKGFDLGELLKNVSNPDTGREQIEYIRLDLIDGDPNNFYRLSDVEQLADNISVCGLQQPIRVRQQENGRYVIVSGHRRRAALEILAKEDPQHWQEVACIVEDDAASPSLQQLRLIYANSNTRKLTPAETDEQALQVEKLLYQLKEEGYEFPGRMRDHVAQAVGASKTKLARLKVIRENLAKCWEKTWKSNAIGESVAYALAQQPQSWQQRIFNVHGKEPKYLHEDAVREYTKRFAGIDKIKCTHGYCTACDNRERMMEKSCTERWIEPCRKGCCYSCSTLASCKKSCSHLSTLKKTMKDVAKEAERKAAEAQAERDAPTLALIRDVYKRVGHARAVSGVSVEKLYAAQKCVYASIDDDKQSALETGSAEITTYTTLPFGYSFYPSSAAALVRVADLLDCSIDYLLGRTEDMRPVAGWQTGDPREQGEYVVMVRYDSAGEPTPEKLWWTPEGWEMFGKPFLETFTDAVILGWMPMIEDSEAPPVIDDSLTAAVDVIREAGAASVSMLQRRLKIGYAAASDLMEQLEKAGIIGPFNGSQPREVLIDTEVSGA